jgi:phage tail-like protein
MPAVGNLLNVCGGHRFRVEIDGIALMGFREVEGVCVNIEVQDFREGTDISSISRTGPGVVHYGPLVLRNAMTGSAGNKDLWTWVKQVIDGEEDVKRNVSIVIMDRKGNDKFRFNLTGAWPSSWRLGKLESHSGAPLFEELILQYENLNVP